MIEMTIDQVKRNPQMFMYIWVTEAFKNPRVELGKYAKPILVKKANEEKVIKLSAQKYGVKAQDYVDAIRESFNEAFDMYPPEALQRLALGEDVAGKNWAKGVYGVGALTDSWSGTNISVDNVTGKILQGGVEVPGQSASYSAVGKNKINGYTVTIDGMTYSSRCRNKKNFAGLKADGNGIKYNPDGTQAKTADLSSLWEGCQLVWNAFVEWLIKVFGNLETGEEKEVLNQTNTFPSQVDDGMATQSSSLTEVLSANSGLILLALGAGTLLATGGLPGMKKKKGKKSRK